MADLHEIYADEFRKHMRRKSIYDILRAATRDEFCQLRDIVLRAEKWSMDDRIRSCTDPKHDGSYLANEICLFGGNSVVNRFRGVIDGTGAGGPDYDVIVKDVADKLKANYPAGSSVEEIESAMIQKVLGDAWTQMNEAQRVALLDECKLSGKAWTSGASAMALQAVFRAGGFRSYQLLVIVVNGVVSKAIGVGLVNTGLSLTANAALTRTASILVGPFSWPVTILTTAYQIAGPSYKVTVPSVLYIALLRRRQEAGHCGKCGAIFVGGNTKYCSECGEKMPQ